MPTFPEEKLREISSKMLTAADASAEQASILTDVLMEASLFGIDSHGIRALPGHLRNLKTGRIQPDAEIKVLKDTPTTALWEGGREFGHVVGKRAMKDARARLMT